MPFEDLDSGLWFLLCNLRNTVGGFQEEILLYKSLQSRAKKETVNKEGEEQRLQKIELSSSREIRGALKNEELRKLICNINCSADAENELEKAMESEEFFALTEKILTTISQSVPEI